ncbi:MAG: amino acid permease [Acidobacteria bacterium]|nr:amino acid permease [Acidobacteriota bacterium]MBI3469949.1 amino acid permease [Candidatus Solibacter usitatus]
MEETTGLKRDLGAWSAAAIVVGTVIGSGVFIVANTMTQRVGSPAMVFLVWIVGGLLSLSGALSYAELSAAMPGAGGEYVYLREAYGPLWSFVYGWTQMWVAKSGSIATLATAFILYFANFFPEVKRVVGVIPLPLGTNGAPLEVSVGQLLAMVLILLLAGVNYLGVKIGGEVQVVFTLCKVGLIVFVVAFGVFAGAGSLENFQTAIPVTGGAIAFFAALRASLWAYDGWNNVSMVASEVRDPARNLPRSLIWGTAAVMLIYLAANAAYFHVLSAREVAASDLVAADMMRKILGAAGANAVSVAAMISIFAALNGSILSGSRVPYAMARDRYFFGAVARVHPRFHTPGVSILGLSAWSALLVLSGRYDQLFTYVIFASWILYGMTTAAVLVLRRKRPELARPYRAFGYPMIPVLFVLIALGLVLSTLIDSPRESVMGLGLVALGLPFYFYWNRRRRGN